MRRKNDLLWKGLLEVIFDDMLRFIFPAADQDFDLARGFEYLDKELIEMYPEPDKESSTRYVDKLVKVFHRDGNEEWMLVHVEVQGWPDPNFAVRMLTYYYRIFDRHRRPVTALAIFTGPDTKNMPDRYEYHGHGTHLVYQYNTLYIRDWEEEQLSHSDSPFAIALLTAREREFTGQDADNQLLKYKLYLTDLVRVKGFSELKMVALLQFIKNYEPFADPETNRIFIEEVDNKNGKKNTMDIFQQIEEMKKAEGKEEGRAEERKNRNRIFVENLLASKKHTDAEIASLADVTSDFVKDVKNGRNFK